MALTDIQIKNAKTPEKKIKLTDGAGMYLLLHPNGSKYWRMQYRFKGKQKTYAIYLSFRTPCRSSYKA